MNQTKILRKKENQAIAWNMGHQGHINQLTWKKIISVLLLVEENWVQYNWALYLILFFNKKLKANTRSELSCALLEITKVNLKLYS